MELNDINTNKSTSNEVEMSDVEDNNSLPDKGIGNIKLQPFVAPVNHNTLTSAKAINIVHTLMGNFCHGDKEKVSQMEDMRNDACILIGYHDKVRFVIYCQIIQILNNLFQHLPLHHLQTLRYQTEGLLEMIRLNSKQLQDNVVTQNLFPPSDNFFKEFFLDDYQAFLKTNATTYEGMKIVAKHYEVEEDWNSYLNLSSKDNQATDYYKLLYIVKTLSKNDNLWISFVEGLHRHAAIVMCLTCSSFDLEGNNIVHESLKKKDFKIAEVPHYKKPQLSPIQVLNSIMKGDFDAPMLMNPFPIQVLLPSIEKKNNIH